ncbi:MAG: hypothetical protein K6A15_07915 [Treponema sp.]|nr:hypothetical protein [Treponema sp.]
MKEKSKLALMAEQSKSVLKSRERSKDLISDYNFMDQKIIEYLIDELYNKLLYN